MVEGVRALSQTQRITVPQNDILKLELLVLLPWDVEHFTQTRRVLTAAVTRCAFQLPRTPRIFSPQARPGRLALQRQPRITSPIFARSKATRHGRQGDWNRLDGYRTSLAFP